MYVVCMCVFVGAYVSVFVSCLQLLCMYVHSYVCTMYVLICTTRNYVVCSVHAFSHPMAVRIYVISRSCHPLAQALKADV